MKTLLAISIILLFISCRTKKESEHTLPSGHQWNIDLQNNLGTVSLILPNRLDTLFIWDQTSDCGDGCTHVDYRIQRKAFPIFKERGWYWWPRLDSVDQFTIKHAKLTYPYNQQDSGSLDYLAFRLKNEITGYHPSKFEIDTNLIISGKPFYIIGFSTFDSVRKANYYYLNSMTSVNRNVLEFYFEHRISRSDSISANFIINSFNYLQTLKINRR